MFNNNWIKNAGHLFVNVTSKSLRWSFIKICWYIVWFIHCFQRKILGCKNNKITGQNARASVWRAPTRKSTCCLLVLPYATAVLPLPRHSTLHSTASVQCCHLEGYVPIRGIFEIPGRQRDFAVFWGIFLISVK